VDGDEVRVVVVAAALTSWKSTGEVPLEKFASDVVKLAVMVCVPADVSATLQSGTEPPDSVTVQRLVPASVSR
jgi:3-polyprenyl-4-hydroxybenzoate decarboxylase